MVNLTDCPAGDTNQICGLLSGLGVGTGNFLTAITPASITLISVFAILGVVILFITGLVMYMKHSATSVKIR